MFIHPYIWFMAIRGFRISKFKLMEGCPYTCAYCFSSGSILNRILAPAEAASYLRILRKDYGLDGFFFLSDTINVSTEYLNSFCDELIRQRAGILWSDCARADNLNLELLEKLNLILLIYQLFFL